MRVARSRRLVAEGYALATVARVMQISRQALYRVPTQRTAPRRRPVFDPVEQAIVAEAIANQTDGYRMVCAFVRRKLGVPVNRKRVLRVMRERKLIQRRRPLERRRRPGFFRVERPILSGTPDSPSGATRLRDCPALQPSYLSTRDRGAGHAGTRIPSRNGVFAGTACRGNRGRVQ